MKKLPVDVLAAALNKQMLEKTQNLSMDFGALVDSVTTYVRRLIRYDTDVHLEVKANGKVYVRFDFGDEVIDMTHMVALPKIVRKTMEFVADQEELRAMATSLRRTARALELRAAREDRLDAERRGRTCAPAPRCLPRP